MKKTTGSVDRSQLKENTGDKSPMASSKSTLEGNHNSPGKDENSLQKLRSHREITPESAGKLHENK